MPPVTVKALKRCKLPMLLPNVTVAVPASALKELILSAESLIVPLIVMLELSVLNANVLVVLLFARTISS